MLTLGSWGYLMKLTSKVIEDVVSEIAGKDVVPLVLNLKGKKHVSEFTLASTIDREVNETRNMLYRLHNVNLVSFIRRKDKKKGWYVYYWTFNKKHVQYLASDLKKKRLDILNDRLLRERSSNFFTCLNNCIRLDFEQASEFGFKCPECGLLLNQEDNKEQIQKLKNHIDKIKEELEVI
jgi:transcription initiation factor TFIIE subunit alpha